MKLICLTFLTLLLYPVAVSAIRITEVMHDVPGMDTGREWVELHNDSEQNVDLSLYEVREGNVGHKISSDGHETVLLVPAGEYIVVANNPEKFRIDWPAVQNVVRSAISLRNTGELIEITSDGVVIDSATIVPELGALGDGNSLQIANDSWKSMLPTPGRENMPSVTLQQPASSTPIIHSPAASSKQKIAVQVTVKPQAHYGVAHEFRGKAMAYGGLVMADEKVRYLWNFGDGTFSEGQNITHAYRLPGRYSVVLSVAYGEHTASEYLYIEVLAPNIAFLVEREGRWLEIDNPNTHALDMSDWIIRPLEPSTEKIQQFFLPKLSIVQPSSTMKITAETAGFPLQSGVILYYPNGAFHSSTTPKTTPTSSVSATPSIKQAVTHIPKMNVVDMAATLSEKPALPEISIVATSSELAFAEFISFEQEKNENEFNQYILIIVAMLACISVIFWIAKKHIS